MAKLVRLTHSTTYQYDRFVSMGPHLVRLRPAPQSRTNVPAYALRVEPEPHFLNWIQDPYGNHMARVYFPEKVDHFAIHVELTADMTVYNPFDFFLDPEAESWPFEIPSELARDLAPYRDSVTAGPRVTAFLQRLPPTPAATIPYLVAVNTAVQQAVAYNIRMEQNVQSPEVTLERGNGSCRDSALLLVAILQQLGFAARFVSGYLIQLVPDEKPRTGPAPLKEDFTDLHAWAEVYVPGAGWIGLDATSGLLAGEGHIPLAAAPRPATAAPVEGALEPCEVTFHHEMTVTRLADDPRAARPFPHGGHEALDALGESLDRRLDALGFTLTTGGEPTFVSEEHREDDEWNGEAMGPRKKILARQLMERLRACWAPDGVLHVAQGKWYPGESLPRWAFSCWWTGDGNPVWEHPDLLADESIDYQVTHEDALRYLTELVRCLGVEERFIIPAYEDPLHVLITERDLPVNLEPGDPRLAKNEDRRRLARALSVGVDVPTGYVLPLAKGSWKSGPWPTRAGRLVLVPGDSPVGLRLPMDTMPWADDGEDTNWFPEDAFSAGGPRAPFRPARSGRSSGSRRTVEPTSQRIAVTPWLPVDDPEGNAGQNVQEQHAEGENPPLAVGESAAWVVRTALTVQARDGVLYVFLPPMRTATDWLELVHEVERAAVAAELPVVLEGYTPPPDPNVLSFQITPDPGVIEVNIPPAATWSELRRTVDDLWREAREVGLSTVKYLVGGQEVATGGGCHWVMGGPTPAESPFLRRPDLLRSWVTYLNHHPSLSYLFAGLFVGPTCQAPRPDEANPALLHDLDLAFTELDRTEKITPWLADRIFRNLLVDGSGNTHRSELCIDKLYSPDRPGGRLGLVEFRAFEMAVHRDTALSQALLLRALTVGFLEQPYRERLKRWGSELRDKWMLPAFLEDDILTVLDDLQRSGIMIPEEPIRAHLDFRFPMVGHMEYAQHDQESISLEVRQALEPWPVMGEEGGAGGTVRMVDSSVERLEVRLRSTDHGRYAVLCEGKVVPLVPAPRDSDTWVGAVRFKAWKLPSGLHPTIAPRARLSFDLYDRYSGSIVDGCTYSVDHPAGRNYETPPVNAFEAEARRNARFRRVGTPLSDTASHPELVIDDEYVHTLDLRQ